MSPGAPQILLIDLRAARTDLLREALEGLGGVTVRRELPARSDVRPSVVVVDPPLPKLALNRLRQILRLHPDVPVLLLGQAPELAEPALHALPGPLVPSRLVSVVLDLMRPEAGSRSQASTRLAGLVPLAPAVRSLFERLVRARVPVLLAGEPGTGKSLLARTRLVGPGGTFARLELPLAQALGDRLAGGGQADLLYVSDIAFLSRTDELAILDRLEAPHGARLAFGVSDPAQALPRLGDDLRLRLEPFLIHLPRLRDRGPELPGLFTRLLRVLAEEHALEPPQLTDAAAQALQAHLWPLNFEELVAAATRSLFLLAGQHLDAADLGLGRGAARSSPEIAPVRGPVAAGPRSLAILAQELAHEIKNPLVSIKTFTQLLPERFEDPDFRDSYHHMVSQDVERIDAILGELSDFTLLRDPVPEVVDLGAVLTKSCDVHRFHFRKRAADLVVSLPDAPVMVKLDRELLGYALDGCLREVLPALNEGGRLLAELVAGPERGAAEEAAAGAPPTAAPELNLLLQRGSQTRRAARAGGTEVTSPRLVLGLRYTLARHVLALVGAEMEVQDTLEGVTRIRIRFHEQR